MHNKIPFRRTSSVLGRLNWAVGLVVVSFAVELLGMFFAGSYIIKEFNATQQLNRLVDLTIDAVVSLDEAQHSLNQTRLKSKKIGTERIFEVHYKHSQESLSKAVEFSKSNPFIKEQLLGVNHSLRLYQRSVINYLSESKSKLREAKNYSDTLDLQNKAETHLRKVQKSIKELQSASVEKIYYARYFVLIVSTLGTLLCIAFIIISGGAVVKRVRRSIDNLLGAAKEVINGNLSYQAPVIENDEFGWVTFVFNFMVKKLNRGQANLRRLYEISAKLSGTADPDKIAEVLLKQSINALGANWGMVLQYPGAGMKLEKVISSDEGNPEFDAWLQRAPDVSTPFSKALFEREPIWIESRDDHKQKWPELSMGKDALSYVVLPLLASNTVLGVMILSFEKERYFAQEDRDFCQSISRQCAQSLYRAQLYGEAKHAVQIRDEFLSIASHELKTPITPLKLQVQNLLRLIESGRFNELTDEQKVNLVGKADGQINRLTRLIDELLDVSRLSTGSIELTKEKLDVSAMIQQTVSKHRNELENARCEVRLQLENKLMTEVDPVRLEQIIYNLLTNAMRYGAGKPIEIYAFRTKREYLEINVRDYGPGIDQKDQKRIFNRFERASSSTNFGGLGLGLYIVRQIVQLHHGSVRVESSLGKGAIFTVQLPLLPEQQQTTAPMESHP